MKLLTSQLRFPAYSWKVHAGCCCLVALFLLVGRTHWLPLLVDALLLVRDWRLSRCVRRRRPPAFWPLVKGALPHCLSLLWRWVRSCSRTSWPQYQCIGKLGRHWSYGSLVLVGKWFLGKSPICLVLVCRCVPCPCCVRGRRVVAGVDGCAEVDGAEPCFLLLPFHVLDRLCIASPFLWFVVFLHHRSACRLIHLEIVIHSRYGSRASIGAVR